MFGFTWLTLRQAEQALRSGRLEEAVRLLEQPSVRNHRRGAELTSTLAHAFLERGERALDHDNPEGAWANLLQAEHLGLADRSCERLRQKLVQLALAELRGVLLAGDLVRAEQAIVILRQRQVASGELGLLEEGTRAWRLAREQANLGEFSLAQQHVAQARRLLGVNPLLETFERELVGKQERFPELLARLHESASAQNWQEVVERAEQVLALAPGHVEARQLRSRAWRALQPETVSAPQFRVEEPKCDVDLPPRFFLWIDGVGGYLICLSNRLTFGQALPDARVDIPLVADVSRLHATLIRDSEGYVLEAVRPIQINGVSVQRALLRSGDRVTLGASCQFQFRLPVAGNLSARLDLVSGHRLPTSVDGVLLLAETLVLGRGQAHVAVPELPHSLVLFRHQGGLGMRYPAGFRLNGQPQTGRVLLPSQATITTDELAFAVEMA
jgi:hypothetical protein